MRQQIYSSLPKSVLDDALTDENRVANIAINEYGDVVGFFVLHQYYQHEGYDTPENVVYVRSLSINEVSRKWVWNYDDDVFTSICTRFIL